MKRLIALVVAMVMVVTIGFCSTSDVAAKEYENKIMVTDVTVNKSKVTVKIKITTDGKKEVSWGEAFTLERYENGEWRELTMRENAGWDDIAYSMVYKDGTPVKVGYQSYTLTSLYYRKDLTPAKYRICMGIDFDEADRYAEFVIPEFKQIKLAKNTKVQVNKGTVIKLKVSTKKTVKWTSSNEKVATVNKNGSVTTKKKGKATIKAKFGKKTLRCVVSVHECGIQCAKRGLCI